MENISYSYFDAQPHKLSNTLKNSSVFMPFSWMGVLAGLTTGVVIQLILNRLGISLEIDGFQSLFNKISFINISTLLWATSIFIFLAVGTKITNHLYVSNKNKEKKLSIAYSISRRGIRGKQDYKYICSANKKFISYMQY